MADLRQFLDELFAPGPIPFSRFMEAALYHPEFGYYTANIRDLGSRGDFATSVTLAPVLGRGIARWVRRELVHFSGRGDPHLVEVGPGNGALMKEVLAAVPWRRRRRLRIHLVEISPALAARQRETLSRHRRRIRWHHDMKEAVDVINRTGPGPVLIYSNECVDAFPARVFRIAPEGGSGAVQELHVRYREGLLSETWLSPATTPDSTAFGAGPPPGQRFEVHDSYREYLHSWVPAWRRGAMLTIDYGGAAESLHERRPAGTVRAYWRHQRLAGDDIYARFGRQDLTADVNFSDLARWGEQLGLQTAGMVTQSSFLREAAREDTAAADYLADPLGPGGAFQVLHQRRSPADGH